jgi:hypothetical protein
MGRNDDEARKHRRTLDDLEKGLRRGDAERVAEAFGRLPAELRAPLRAKAAARFGESVRRAEGRKEKGPLQALARHADAAPELLTEGRPADDAAALAWPLFGAAFEQRDFARAGRLFALARPVVEAGEPALAALLTAALGAAGAVDPVALRDAGVVAPRAAAGSTGPTAAPPPPATVDAVRPGLRALESVGSWAQLSGALSRQWLPRCGGPVGQELRRAVLDRCLREALRRRRDREGDASDPLALALRCVDEIEDLGAVLDDVVVLLRLTFAGGVANAADRAPSKLLLAVLKHPALAEMAVGLACSVEPKDGVDATLALLRKLWAVRHEAPLLFRAVSLWNREHTIDCEHVLPEWIARGAASLPLDAIAAWMLRPGRSRVTEVTPWLPMLIPAHSVDPLVEAIWPKADEALRVECANLVAQAVMVPDDEVLRGFSGPQQMLEEYGGMIRPGGRLAGKARERVDRFVPRMLTLGTNFLLTALTLRRDPAEARALAARYFEEGGSPRAAIDAVVDATYDPPSSLTHALADEFLARFGGDVALLAEALRALDEDDAPPGPLHRFANAFLDAVEGVDRALTITEATAERMARQITGRWRRAARKKPKTAGLKKAPAKKKAPAEKPKKAPAEKPKKAPAEKKKASDDVG